MLMNIGEVSALTHVSIRTLRHYDKIGLLRPTQVTEAGYRLYDDAALETLQQILLFRELEFPLKDIKEIISSPDFDRSKALEQQIELLQQHAEETVQTMEEYQKKMMHSADSLEKECQWAAKNLEKQAGSVSEKFSQAISEQTTLMKKLTKRCFRIALIPGLILLLLELVPRIWQLIFGS
mgnify:CR=1 FL=1